MKNSQLLAKFIYLNQGYGSLHNHCDVYGTYGCIDNILIIIIFQKWIFHKYNVRHWITEIIEILSYGSPFKIEDGQYEAYNINFNKYIDDIFINGQLNKNNESYDHNNKYMKTVSMTL